MVKIINRSQLTEFIGEEIGVSNWFEITQSDVNRFADVTRDHQFIHTDPAKAADSPFGGTIAHGFLTLSMLSHFAEQGIGIWVEGADMGVNYGFDKVRFVRPVPVGSRIRARSTLLQAEEKMPGQFLFKLQVTVEIEDRQRPALLAEWLTMAVITKKQTAR